MKTCLNCKQKLEDDAVVCENCGGTDFVADADNNVGSVTYAKNMGAVKNFASNESIETQNEQLAETKTANKCEAKTETTTAGDMETETTTAGNMEANATSDTERAENVSIKNTFWNNLVSMVTGKKPMVMLAGGLLLSILALIYFAFQIKMFKNVVSISGVCVIIEIIWAILTILCLVLLCVSIAQNIKIKNKKNKNN
jgi:hypothetical protein